ncbi:hypothetical protein DL89DRAFT_44699 [Linderina pennispora]|uniref:Uncharacterized protein n=1 Tax=Linderina pennispora TaxID=61395 RepID=A0A1Y1W1S9_9FUNG|nr:uncharacterized protein DL89DRAFT_44699 [Linderina pennispora]ORX67437.1 hypothetical protein DL89DRAFT_44699 [Linderina pennispora]
MCIDKGLQICNFAFAQKERGCSRSSLWPCAFAGHANAHLTAAGNGSGHAADALLRRERQTQHSGMWSQRQVGKSAVLRRGGQALNQREPSRSFPKQLLPKTSPCTTVHEHLESVRLTRGTHHSSSLHPAPIFSFLSILPAWQWAFMQLGARLQISLQPSSHDGAQARMGCNMGRAIGVPRSAIFLVSRTAWGTCVEIYNWEYPNHTRISYMCGSNSPFATTVGQRDMLHDNGERAGKVTGMPAHCTN